jgi:hypothetical protein
MTRPQAPRPRREQSGASQGPSRFRWPISDRRRHYLSWRVTRTETRWTDAVACPTIIGARFVPRTRGSEPCPAWRRRFVDVTDVRNRLRQALEEVGPVACRMAGEPGLRLFRACRRRRPVVRNYISANCRRSAKSPGARLSASSNAMRARAPRSSGSMPWSTAPRTMRSTPAPRSGAAD